MMAIAGLAEGFPDELPPSHQWGLGFRTAPYRVDFVNAPAEPFFSVSREGGSRVLHLNTAHRFHERIYDGPTATPDLRATLEVMLFSLGDILLELPPEQRSLLLTQVDRWSHRLDDALNVFSTNLGDEDVGEAAWLGNDT